MSNYLRESADNIKAQIDICKTILILSFDCVQKLYFNRLLMLQKCLNEIYHLSENDYNVEDIKEVVDIIMGQECFTEEALEEAKRKDKINLKSNPSTGE